MVICPWESLHRGAKEPGTAVLQFCNQQQLPSAETRSPFSPSTLKPSITVNARAFSITSVYQAVQSVCPPFCRNFVVLKVKRLLLNMEKDPFAGVFRSGCCSDMVCTDAHTPAAWCTTPCPPFRIRVARFSLWSRKSREELFKSGEIDQARLVGSELSHDASIVF